MHLARAAVSHSAVLELKMNDFWDGSAKDGRRANQVVRLNVRSKGLRKRQRGSGGSDKEWVPWRSSAVGPSCLAGWLAAVEKLMQQTDNT